MRRVILILGLVVLASCTNADAPSNDGSAAALAATTLGPQSHAGIKMTPEIRACRDACWAATPYNECARQRDVCYTTATSEVDRRHCRHMSHTCRKTRRKCLQGCWIGKAPAANPLAPADDEADDSLDDQ